MGWRTEAIKAAMRNRPEGLMQFFMPNRRIPPDRNTREFLEAYTHSPRMSPITKIATDLAPIEGHLYRIKSDGKREEIEDHPFLDFMRRPNPLPEMTRTELWKLAEKYLLIKGEAASIIERDAYGYPIELWPVPTHWVLTIPTMGNPTYTILNRDGRQRTVPAEDVFVQRELNPVDPYARGLGAAEAVADEIETDEYMSKWSKQFFYNDATPPVIIAAPGLTQTEYERFEAKWKEKYGGIANSHKMGVVPRDITPHKLSDTRKEMDYIESRRFLRDSVMNHFGMPPEIMGVVENSNRATVTQAKSIYAENVLSPRISGRQDAVNIQLLSAWGDDLVYEYEDVIPEDIELALEVANAGMQHSALLVDEWREKMGFDPLENDAGKVMHIPFAMTQMRPEDLTESARQNGENPPQQERKSLKKNGSRNGKEQFAGRLMMQLQDVTERMFEVNLQRYFSHQTEEVIRAMQLGTKADTPDFWARLLDSNGMALKIEGLRKLAASALDTLLDWGKQENALTGLLNPLWEQAFKDGAKNCANAYTLPAIQSPTLTDRLRKYGLQRVKDITDTTREKLANSLADGIDAGESRAQLIQRIQEHMPGVQAERAAGIAITEAHTSIQEGNMTQMQYAGMKTKKWKTAGDSSVRSTHQRLDGVTVDIDKPFPNNLMYPGDPAGDPWEIIRCRCYLLPGDI